MLLVAGGTGILGTQIVRVLAGRGLDVRILTRDPARATHLVGEHVELVTGDVRDSRAVGQAMRGARVVVSAIHGLVGSGTDNPRTVDRLGNATLIRAAEQAGVEHLVLVSVHGAAIDHPLELARMKYAAEQVLRTSTLAWTIIRPTVFMETWASLLGEPLLRSRRTLLFGSGNNPINFVSAHDVARLVDAGVTDQTFRGAQVEIGGPENLTLKQFVHTFEEVTGVSGTKRRVPLPVMRGASVLLRLFSPRLARLIQASVVMDTADMRFNAATARQRYPTLPFTTLAEMIRRDYLPAEHEALDGVPRSKFID